MLFAESGCAIYLDCKDAALPAKPDQATAREIKARIAEDEWFIFLATANSIASRWCPWEIGYADCRKAHDKIIILDTKEGGNWYGNEYLQLYSQISSLKDEPRRLAVFKVGPSNIGTLLENIR